MRVIKPPGEPSMPAANAAEYFVAVILIVTGLSHLARPRLWSLLFVDLLGKPYAGLWIGMLTLLVGVPIAAAHNRWEWDPRTIATVIGWAWSVKGTLYLLVPGLPLKVAAPHIKRPAHFAYAGLVALALGAGLVVGILRAPGEGPPFGAP